MRIKLTGLVLLIMLILNACHYEEGPFLTLHSAKKIIAGKHWKIASFTANGADSMSYIYRYHLEGEWDFSRDNGPDYAALGVTNSNCYYVGSWEGSNKDISTLFYYSMANTNNIVTYDSPSAFPNDWVMSNNWNIIKLKKNDLKLRASKNGISYEIEFKPY
jgi:hypothetical protein